VSINRSLNDDRATAVDRPSDLQVTPRRRRRRRSINNVCRTDGPTDARGHSHHRYKIGRHNRQLGDFEGVGRQKCSPATTVTVTPGFQHNAVVPVSVSVAVSVTVSVKTVSVPAVVGLCRCCWGVCAAIARQVQESGCPVSRAKEWAELQARTNGMYIKIEFDLISTDQRQRRTYGNGERYFFT